MFQDGDYVFAHTLTQSASSSEVGFHVFRFEGEKVVKHWDTIETIPTKGKWQNSNRKF